MKEIIINLTTINSVDDFYDLLLDALDAPEGSGRNLDALHDILKAICEPTDIIVYGYAHFAALMPDYARTFEEMILDATDNDYLEFDLIDNDDLLEEENGDAIY